MWKAFGFLGKARDLDVERHETSGLELATSHLRHKVPLTPSTTGVQSMKKGWPQGLQDMKRYALRIWELPLGANSLMFPHELIPRGRAKFIHCIHV